MKIIALLIASVAATRNQLNDVCCDPIPPICACSPGSALPSGNAARLPAPERCGDYAKLSS